MFTNVSYFFGGLIAEHIKVKSPVTIILRICGNGVLDPRKVYAISELGGGGGGGGRGRLLKMGKLTRGPLVLYHLPKY